VKPTQCLRNC
jgi:hypothetical protein